MHEVDVLLRTGKIEDAISLVDQRLMKKTLGFTDDEMILAREAGARLRDRRLARGRSNK